MNAPHELHDAANRRRVQKQRGMALPGHDILLHAGRAPRHFGEDFGRQDIGIFAAQRQHGPLRQRLERFPEIIGSHVRRHFIERACELRIVAQPDPAVLENESVSRVNLPFLRAHRRKGRAGGEAHQSNGLGHRSERRQLADIALYVEQSGKVDRRADVVEHGRAHEAGLA